MRVVNMTAEARGRHGDVGETIVFHLAHLAVEISRHFVLLMAWIAEREAFETFRSNL